MNSREFKLDEPNEALEYLETLAKLTPATGLSMQQATETFQGIETAANTVRGNFKPAKKPKHPKGNPALLDPVYTAGDAEIWNGETQVASFNNPDAFCQAFTYCKDNDLSTCEVFFLEVSTWKETAWVGKTTNAPPGR